MRTLGFVGEACVCVAVHWRLICTDRGTPGAIDALGVKADSSHPQGVFHWYQFPHVSQYPHDFFVNNAVYVLQHAVYEY